MSILWIVFDVDGTLTDGTIHVSGSMKFGNEESIYESKHFSARDGLLIRVLTDIGINTMFLTGRRSIAVDERARDLKITEVMQGVKDKRETLMRFLEERNIPSETVAYIGDDLNDYTAMALCGYKACPADAVIEICEFCDYVSPYNGGHGAVRDICEHILRRDGKYDAFLNLFSAQR